MSKREDAKYLKILSHVYKSHVHHWASIPLVVMDTDSQIAQNSMNKAGILLQKIINGDKSYINELSDLLEIMNILPLNEFMLLNKTISINQPIEKGTMEYNYYWVSKITPESMLIKYPTLHDGFSIVEIKLNENKTTKDINFRSEETDGSNIVDFTESKKTNENKVKAFMSAMFLTVLTFFEEIENSDLYPISKKYTGKRRKHNPKKPWQRADLETICFLNTLPSTPGESQGGHHASPRYHHRRATKRKLTHSRYKNHPKYGQTINIKASWVGNKTKIVKGITYKVLEREK